MTMTTSPNLLQKTDKFIIGSSKKAWQKLGYTGDPLIPKLNELQDFTAPAEGSDLAVIVSKSGDRYYVINREDTSLFLLERTQQFKELREAPSIQRDVIKIARMQQMATVELFRQCLEKDPSLPEVNLSNQQKQNMIEILETMIETANRDLEEPQPFIPPEHRQDFEQQIQRELKQLQTASEHHAEALAAYWSGELSADHFDAISNFMIETRGEPTPERLLWLITTWEQKKETPDPLMPLIQAWQQEQHAKHITNDFDKLHPVSLMDKAILGSVREVVLDLDGTGELPIIHDEIPTIDQLEFWEEDSALPNILPWHRLWNGISHTTKSGAVSHGACIADEVFMALAPKQRVDLQKWDLGTLLRALNANLSEKQIIKNRAKYLTSLIKGLKEVQYMGWEAQSGVYVPIKMPQRIMPTIKSPDDFPVIFEIKIPVSGASGNMLVEKDVIRKTRKKSAKQLNAAKTCYWLIDTYGTQKTKKGEAYLIDPTRPEEVRDADGYLIHPKTRVRLCNSKGRPIRNIIDSEAVRQLPRKPNHPQRNRYKDLSPADRIRAVFPEGVPQTMSNSTASKRADRAFDDIAKAGYFEIEKLKDGLGGWRIMPSSQHVARYRAVGRTSKKSY